MTKKNGFLLELSVSIFVFILGIYTPYTFYFHSTGPFGVFQWGILILICFGITFNTFLNVIDKKWKGKKRLVPLSICLIGSFVSLSVFYLDHETFEKLDWIINKKNRFFIVQQLQKENYKPDFIGFKKIDSFLPISNGGNEVFIKKCENGISIKFWIDRGMLHNHSEFVYTTCTNEIQEITKIIQQKNDPSRYRQMDKNWYRLNNYD